MKQLLSGVACAFLLAACQASEDPPGTIAHTETQTPVTAVLSVGETVAENNTYRLNWSFDAGEGPVSIAVTTDPESHSGEIIAEDFSATSFEWSPEGGINERHYFIITPAHGESVMTAARLLPLEGGRNFRDLGGYETEDGRTIAWGELYRSGVMTSLTENDYAYLSSLDINVICDLRTIEERTSEPTNWNAGDLEYLYFPDPGEDMSFMSVLMQEDATPQDVRDAFGSAYFGIGHQQAPAYEEMFDRLAAGDAPLAFNCSAGKDRTGVGAALLLTVLGVPRETIVHDYQLSDDYVDYMEEFMSEEARARMLEDNPSYAFFLNLPPEMVEPIMATYPEYIETFFADIEAEYGDVMTFLSEQVNVTPEEVDAIRAQYLN